MKKNLKYFYHPIDDLHVQHYMIYDGDTPIALWIDTAESYINPRWEKIEKDEIRVQHYSSKPLAEELTEKEFNKRMFMIAL